MKKILLALSLVLASLLANSQIDYRIGHIVTNEKDSVFGAVAFRSNAQNYQSCLFKIGGKVTEYRPDQIIGFGLQIERKTYVSSILEGQFVEVVMEGSISIYKHSTAFYVSKDGKAHSLETKSVEVEVDGEVVTQVVSNWRIVLTELVGGCPEATRLLNSYFQISEKNLTALISAYNGCENADYGKVKKQGPLSRLGFGVLAGGVSSSLSVEASIHYEYLDDSYSSITPFVGLAVVFPLPIESGRIALQAEVQAFQSNFSAVVKRVTSIRTGYYDTFINFTTISLPVSVRYANPLTRKYTLHIQAGANYDSNIMASTRVLSEKVEGNIVTFLPETEAFTIVKNQFGIWAGAGLLKSFKKFDAGVNLRYHMVSSLDEAGEIIRNSSLSINHNRISAGIILFKK